MKVNQCNMLFCDLHPEETQRLMSAVESMVLSGVATSDYAQFFADWSSSLKLDDRQALLMSHMFQARALLSVCRALQQRAAVDHCELRIEPILAYLLQTREVVSTRDLNEYVEKFDCDGCYVDVTDDARVHATNQYPRFFRLVDDSHVRRGDGWDARAARDRFYWWVPPRAAEAFVTAGVAIVERA